MRKMNYSKNTKASALGSLNIYKGKITAFFSDIEKVKSELFPAKSDKEEHPDKLLFNERIEKILSKTALALEEIGKDSIGKIDLGRIDVLEGILNDPLEQVGLIVDDRINSIDSNDNNSSKIDQIVKLTKSKEELDRLLSLKRRKKLLEAQKDTLEEISTNFNEMQKQEVERFLTGISEKLNSFYNFMSDEEQVKDIKLQPIESKGEFSGIGLELFFYGEKTGSAKKYLSESRINCLGLSLFLSSVILFNKKSKFFILDDVISSFDKPHRRRFGQLLKERFADYQIFVLTHEREWFDLFAPQVKKVGWQIQETTWNRNDGIQIRVPLINIQSQIEDKINKSDPSGLGNLLGQYTESILKKINYNLEIKMPFRFNETNEKRTLTEFFSNFRAGIKKKSGIINENGDVANRLESAINLLNNSSHDRRYNEDLSDLRTTYKDIEIFKNIFYCRDCEKFVSIKNTQGREDGKELISCRCCKKKISYKCP